MSKRFLVKPVGNNPVYDKNGNIIPSEGIGISNKDIYYFRLKREGLVTITDSEKPKKSGKKE